MIVAIITKCFKIYFNQGMKALVYIYNDITDQIM